MSIIEQDEPTLLLVESSDEERASRAFLESLLMRRGQPLRRMPDGEAQEWAEAEGWEI